MSRRGLGLAVVASLAVLALATTIATVASAQPPRHVDHDRAEPSQAVLVATTQGMVDAGANGLEATLAGEEPAQATQQGQRAAQLGGFLAQAAATSTRNVSLQPLLATLGPIGAQMGPSLQDRKSVV